MVFNKTFSADGKKNAVPGQALLLKHLNAAFYNN